MKVLRKIKIFKIMAAAALPPFIFLMQIPHVSISHIRKERKIVVNIYTAIVHFSSTCGSAKKK
jgi:hypothetical protein